MSPRSEEFMGQARDRASAAAELAQARTYVDGAGDFIAAVEHMLEAD